MVLPLICGLTIWTQPVRVIAKDRARTTDSFFSGCAQAALARRSARGVALDGHEAIYSEDSMVSNAIRANDPGVG